MLTEILEAAAPTKRTPRPGRSGISMSSLFPCPYRLRLVHEDRYWPDDMTPQQFYNMSDGWTQEEQSLDRLRKAGIEIIDRQKRVVVGKSQVPGSIDGAFVLNDVRRLWEHKAYGVNTDALWTLNNRGMDALPSQKAQLNGYMLGDGSEEAVFFVKVKDNNTYVDRLVKIDRPFIDEIVEWCDRIRLEDWQPEPAECLWCSPCRFGCFPEALDMSWIGTADSSDAVERWKKGKQLKNVGEMLMEEADAVLIGVRDANREFIQRGLVGDKELLMLPGLEISKVVVRSSKVVKARILEEFGPGGLAKVLEYTTSTQYRHKET